MFFIQKWNLQSFKFYCHASINCTCILLCCIIKIDSLEPLCRSWYVNSLRPSDAYMRRQSSHHWFRHWLVAWRAPSHYINQCWIIVNWTLANIFLWKFNQYTTIFIEENARETVVCEMASILSRPQCVKVQHTHQNESKQGTVIQTKIEGYTSYETRLEFKSSDHIQSSGLCMITYRTQIHFNIFNQKL